MYIKQITISGFKSYRDATVVGPFSAGHNVVVGRNGSGKSNFFDAVRFVLSDTFSSLRAEERVALLHEGAGASVLSAYVEMVFDNSDGRLPSDRNEVALRRMVGLKKDEYVLDRKNVTRTEVFNLLESAGFSRSNPYYIVQQGKVAALCAMTDRQRLDLLQEVAGTRVYDERREESLKIMEDNDAKMEKITEASKYIDSRLAELESEKEELKAFQRLDKERKALEYTMHVRDLEEAKAALESLDDARAQHRSKADELQARLTEIRMSFTTTEREINSLEPELKRLEGERDSMETKRKQTRDTIAKLQVDVSEAEQVATTAAETVANSKAELRDVQRLIAEKKGQLTPLETQFNSLKNDETNLRKRKAEIDRKLTSLRVKANRSNQFSSVQARDAHIRKSIRETRKRRDGFAAQIVTARRDIERLERGIERNEAKKLQKENEKQELQSTLGGADTDVQDLERERNALMLQRQEAWKKVSELEHKTKDLESNLGRLEAAKRSVLGAGAYHAIKAVMEASASDPRHLGPDRVFGPVLDLIEVDPKFSTAADVTAGAGLTHVVVDSDATAARLVRIMQAKRAGRVTFIPLNRLEQSLAPPPRGTSDAIPLVSKISCDDRFRTALKHIFGRTMVTRTVEIAGEMSKQHGVDCVTLEGDQVNKRGVMTGGYMDVTRSRIDAARYLREARSELASIQPEIAHWKSKAAESESRLSQVTGEIQSRESRHRSARSKNARLGEEINTLQNYITHDKANIPKAEERIQAAEQSITNAEKAIEDLESELNSPMVSGLSAEEEALISELKSELDELNPNLSDVVKERSELEKSVVALRSELTQNLERRASELQKRISDSGDATMEEGDDLEVQTRKALDKKREELQVATVELQSVMDSIKENEGLLERKRRDHNRLSAKLDQGREEEGKINKALEEDKQQVEKRYNQKSIETQKKTDAEKSIRELGSLPADFDKYRDLSMGALMKKLRKVNQSLQSYSHVNKKALDQYLSFTDERESLQRRRQELDTGASAIRQLIEALDQRKDEDILRTFKGVSKYFSEVFAELVPGGKASLIMMKSSGNERRRRDRRESETSRLQYSGVAMKVSFSSTGEAYLLQQLSGGQKSIVALALIFAIQRLDPAPFYLFDEIDANLDATHRQAVANLIRKQAKKHTQFVTTTFRPEFVNAGDMWYGVTHKKKVSSVQEVAKDVALTFIIDEPMRS